jgi:O-acetyl-ADP-ribose deacetylase (regulator of RNase III)
MIRFTHGDLLDAPVDALVNAVNEVGVMGKGIALEFNACFPEESREYQKACARGEVKVGLMFPVRRTVLVGPRWIIHFPTKKHWRFPSQIEWVRSGLVDLLRTIREQGIRSVAIPPLGCGAGGLNWVEIRREIEATFAGPADVEAVVYEPNATTDTDARQRSGN